MAKRETINATYDEKFVKTVVLFADSSKNLYYDTNCQEAVAKADLNDLFLTGVVVFVGHSFFAPVCLDAETGSLVAHDGTQAVTFTCHIEEM